MTPDQMINARYGHILLHYVGDVTLDGSTNREVSVYAAKVKARNLIPYNLVIALTPAGSQVRSSQPLAGLRWLTFYLRSYFDPKYLQATLPLNWTAVLSSDEQQPAGTELPQGLWLKELKDRINPGQRNKYYVFTEPAYATNYVVSVESRAKSEAIAHGNGLRSEYEFDLLLNHDNFNLAVEHL